MAVRHMFFFAFTANVILTLCDCSLEITPAEVVLNNSRSAVLSCNTSFVTDASTIQTVQIRKSEKVNGTALFAIWVKTTSGFGVDDYSSDVSVTGDASATLNLTLDEVDMTYNGSYSCNVSYIDSSSLLKSASTSATLIVLETERPPTLLETLKKSVDAIEENCICAREPCKAAFVVTNKKKGELRGSRKLILPDAVLLKGVETNNTGYNMTTGEFTAPCTGLYYFHLSVALSYTMSRSIVHVKKNSDVMFRVYASGRSYNDQASTATLLTKGDTVSAYVEAVSGYRSTNSNGYITFSGFLQLTTDDIKDDAKP